MFLINLSYPYISRSDGLVNALNVIFRSSVPFLRHSVGFYRLLAEILRRTDDVFRHIVDSFRHLVDLLHSLDGSLLYAVKLAPSAERWILFFSAKGSGLFWKNNYPILLGHEMSRLILKIDKEIGRNAQRPHVGGFVKRGAVEVEIARIDVVVIVLV